MARRKTSTKLRLLQGNSSRRPVGKVDITVPTGMPEPPDYLSVSAVKVWHRIGPMLVEAGLLTPLDATAYASLCQLTGQLEDAEREMTKAGGLFRQIQRKANSKSRRQMKPYSPYTSLINTTTKQLRPLWNHFGMTPDARARIKVEVKKPKDAFEAYLNGSTPPG